MTKATVGVIVLAALFPVPGGSATDPVADCDRRAGHPSDPDKVGEGIDSEKVDVPAAIKACAAAVQAEPANARVRYQLGRVLFYDKQTAKALPYLEAAATAGYRQAQFVFGFVYFDGRNDLAKDPCPAAPLWRKAAANGHYASEISYARGVIKGTFAACGPQADRTEVRRLLESAAGKTKTYYEKLLVEDLLEAAGKPAAP